MDRFRANPRCSCGRCRMAGLMGPAVLVTLGILFLIRDVSYRLELGHTWPLLLIVIGIVLVLQHTAPTEGHIPYGYVPGQPPQQQVPQPSVVVPSANNPDQEAPHV
jgi:hypothetical protein